MILNANSREVFLCVILSIAGIAALARANNIRSYRRAKVAPSQNRPAGVGYQQPFINQSQWLRSNRTQQQNYRIQYNQPGYRPAISNPQQPSYGQRTFNQTRPSWQQPVPPRSPNYSQYPSNKPQGSLNQTRPVWGQPFAPQLPNYPNHLHNKPSLPSNSSWTSFGNQTNLYPKLPSLNLPQPPSVSGNIGTPLAPQPAQGPHNWHSGGQAMLSYGPGHYPLPSGNSNKNPPTIQGPYANIFN